MASPSSSQPMKKLRGGSTPISRQPRGKTDVGVEADDAIARRRAELRRLKEQRNKKASSSTRGRPPAGGSSNTRPPVTSATDLMKPSANLTTKTRSRSTGRAPPPPPVARKLQFNNSGNNPPVPTAGNNRAKSVPPRRPPAPPRAGSTKPSGGGATSESSNTAKSRQAPPRRPAPVDPTTLITGQDKPVVSAPPVSAPPLVSSAESKPPTQQSLPPKKDTQPLAASPVTFPNVGTFSLTSQEVSETADFVALCAKEFGEGWRVADWVDDLKDNLDVSDIATMIRMLAIGESFNEKYFFVLNDGYKFYNSNQAYFFENHGGNPPSNWLVHDQLGDISLGSWYGISGRVLCIKDATTTTEPPLVEEASSKPPLATKTSAASAKIPVEETPAATIPPSTTTEPPTTSRRDRMKQLRDGLESPKTTGKPVKEEGSTSVDPPLISAASARLEEELKRTEVERNEALQKIKQLEDKLTNMTKTTIQHQTPVEDMASVQEIMELYKTEGEAAAMQYAQDKLNKPKQQTGFLTPMMPSTPKNAHSKVAQRVATPHPNRGLVKGNVQQPTDEDLEKRFINTFREAVNFVPHEFSGSTSVNGQSCVFFVRRPYGLPEENDIFDLVSPSTFKAYSQRAHVGDPTTIEVAVGIPFDDSVLCLSGSMGVRYRITLTGSFESKPNVQEPLGSISYIDESANEQEYSLDQIFQEALSVREQYCASMMTTALGFERRRPQQAMPEPGVSAGPKPETAEVGVDTSDMPIPKEIALGESKGEKKDKVEKNEKKEKKSKGESKPKPSDPEELPGAGDVLISFIGILVKGIFGFIFWIFIGLPIATVRTSLTMLLAGAIVGMLYLYALQYHHEALLGGGDSFYYSSSASYHTNIAPGIL